MQKMRRRTERMDLRFYKVLIIQIQWKNTCIAVRFSDFVLNSCLFQRCCCHSHPRSRPPTLYPELSPTSCSERLSSLLASPVKTPFTIWTSQPRQHEAYRYEEFLGHLKPIRKISLRLLPLLSKLSHWTPTILTIAIAETVLVDVRVFARRWSQQKQSTAGVDTSVIGAARLEVQVLPRSNADKEL
jgi:hypothetical protein